MTVFFKREKYSGQRDSDSMVEYVLSKLTENVISIDSSNLKTFHSLNPNSQPNDFDKPSNYWLLIFCYQNKGIKNFLDINYLKILLLKAFAFF
jgi:hypothetical protein